METFRLWTDAMPLRDAWFQLAPHDEKERYRDAGRNPNLTATLTMLMRSYLLDRIHSGELRCLGIQTVPTTSDDPVPIPRTLFAPDHVDIDWAKSSIKVFGRAYDAVRVVPQETSAGLKPARSDKPKRARRTKQRKAKLKRRMGRPPVDKPLRQIVRTLNREGKLAGKSRKQQEDLIRTHARTLHPNLFLRETQPSRAKILEALKAERL